MSTSIFAPPLEPSIAFALLAAGSAERFGGGKLLADLGGRPLWRWAASSAERAGFTTRILIVPEADIFSETAATEGWSVHINTISQEGLASSLGLACEVTKSSQRLVIALADMPFVEPAHLRSLALDNGPLFTRYPTGRNGVPAAFPRDRFAALATLRGDHGAGTLAWANDAPGLAPPSPEQLLDIDTAHDLDRARMLIRK